VSALAGSVLSFGGSVLSFGGTALSFAGSDLSFAGSGLSLGGIGLSLLGSTLPSAEGPSLGGPSSLSLTTTAGRVEGNNLLSIGQAATRMPTARKNTDNAITGPSHQRF